MIDMPTHIADACQRADSYLPLVNWLYKNGQPNLAKFIEGDCDNAAERCFREWRRQAVACIREKPKPDLFAFSFVRLYGRKDSRVLQIVREIPEAVELLNEVRKLTAKRPASVRRLHPAKDEGISIR